MYHRHLIARILALACVIIHMPGFGTAMADDVQTPMALDDVKSSIVALKAETAKLGSPNVEDGELYFGKTKASNDDVDAVVKTLGGEAMLLIKSGDRYVRVATTLNKADHTSAVGTTLDTDSPASAKLNNGEAFYGTAMIFGLPYWVGYEPITDASGAVIGAYFAADPQA